MFKTSLFALALTAVAAPAFAEITISDAYARSSGMKAKAGAAFFMIENSGDEDDRLVSAMSDAAKRVELHTHIEGENGVMRMVEVEEGFAVSAGGAHALARGGDHVMFMGLTAPFEQGNMLSVTLVFEKAGEMVVEIPVDLERKGAMDGTGPKMDHGKMNHGNMGEGKAAQ
jgi:copper(I)-binding protein